ncbi:MAG: hypothetical protein KAS23_14490 [Anaerohalosphaera sp.]|nr:hypothetical protein [Anaerohalosphaera sp.]
MNTCFHEIRSGIHCSSAFGDNDLLSMSSIPDSSVGISVQAVQLQWNYEQIGPVYRGAS